MINPSWNHVYVLQIQPWLSNSIHFLRRRENYNLGTLNSKYWASSWRMKLSILFSNLILSLYLKEKKILYHFKHVHVYIFPSKMTGLHINAEIRLSLLTFTPTLSVVFKYMVLHDEIVSNMKWSFCLSKYYLFLGGGVGGCWSINNKLCSKTSTIIKYTARGLNLPSQHYFRSI